MVRLEVDVVRALIVPVPVEAAARVAVAQAPDHGAIDVVVHDRAEQVIDFTRYDLPAHEPQDMTRKWSLMGEINQKQIRPQDKPRLWKELSSDDQERILKIYPDVATTEKE